MKNWWHEERTRERAYERSVRLPSGEAQAGQKQLTVGRAAHNVHSRHHGGSDGPQPIDHFTRIVKSAHLRVQAARRR